MKTKQELKSEITHKIMELRQKELVEADCILDVLDDCLDPFIDELEQENLENESEAREVNIRMTELTEKYVKEIEENNKAKEIIEKLLGLYFAPIVTQDDLKKQDEIIEMARKFVEE